MSERQVIIHCSDGKWSAAYADSPEEQFDGVTMQEAIGRLEAAHAEWLDAQGMWIRGKSNVSRAACRKRGQDQQFRG